jgi:hypothetical protein
MAGVITQTDTRSSSGAGAHTHSNSAHFEWARNWNNSILYYLYAESTATRPITDTAQRSLLIVTVFRESRPWRWRRHVPPKRRLIFNGLHGGVCLYQKTGTLYSHSCENLRSYIVHSNWIRGFAQCVPRSRSSLFWSLFGPTFRCCSCCSGRLIPSGLQPGSVSPNYGSSTVSFATEQVSLSKRKLYICHFNLSLSLVCWQVCINSPSGSLTFQSISQTRIGRLQEWAIWRKPLIAISVRHSLIDNNNWRNTHAAAQRCLLMQSWNVYHRIGSRQKENLNIKQHKTL